MVEASQQGLIKISLRFEGFLPYVVPKEEKIQCNFETTVKQIINKYCSNLNSFLKRFER